MPIPAFDGILNVLPPHLGNPTQPHELSPYPCTTTELCQRFATSAARKSILEGLLNLRAELFLLGIQGFQWLDGSFLEEIETQEGRDPRDIDAVTFIIAPRTIRDIQSAFATRQQLLDLAWVKSNYLVDHYLLPLCSDPEVIVDNTRYWYGLFSHRRDPERTWKGMLRVELATAADDDPAWQVLGRGP